MRSMAVYACAMRSFPDLSIGVFTSTRVRDGESVLFVVHDMDGDWQFLSSKEERADEAVLAHLSHLLEADSTLSEIADLPAGWRASRRSVGDDWVREPRRDDHPSI